MIPEGAGDLNEICSSLARENCSVKLRGYSAIDKYLGLPALPYLWVETDADMALLARLLENLRYPGVEIADCAADASDGTCYFRCFEDDEKPAPAFSVLSFAYDWRTRRFQDSPGVYPLLKELRGMKDFPGRNGDTPPAPPGSAFLERFSEAGAVSPEPGKYRVIMDGALLFSRYSFGAGARLPDCGELSKALEQCPGGTLPGPETQRVFLGSILVSSRPDLGLEFLKRAGFLDKVWPELALFDDVDHSKEFHPEGNVWNHTLETFRHRKAGTGGAYDLRLSLGLLLHDAGKPASAANGGRRFDGHAELGAGIASRFLERLGFEASLIGDIYYLVRNHMLPAALKRLPVRKTAEIMESPMFPALMELYRCDESSSFKGLDSYYENSAAYQAYLKNLRNPYRSADGKKIGKNGIYSR